MTPATRPPSPCAAPWRRLLFLSSLCAAAALAADAGAPPDTSASLYQLDAAWTNQAGRVAHLSDFRGHPVLLAMVYTRCQASCPLIVSDLEKVEAQLPPAVRAKLRVVLVSFDPARDTPAALAAYATKRKLDTARWTLLTGSPDAVRELAAATGLRFRPTGTGDFIHNNLISVLDGAGVVRFRQSGFEQDPAQTAAAVEALK